MPSLTAASKDITFEVHQTDINENIEEILSIIENAFKTHQNSKEIANTIKQSCDYNFGSYWHCIIGKNFASDVSHEHGSFLFGYHSDDTALMLFKTS